MSWSSPAPGTGVRLRGRHLRVRCPAHVGRGPGRATTAARPTRRRRGPRLDKPIIAMIRGYCIGGGLLTALKADIRIAAAGSQFGVPAARLGLGYGFGGVAAAGRAGRPGVDVRDPVLGPPAVARGGPADRPGQPGGAGGCAGGRGARAWPEPSRGNAPLTVAACKPAIRQARAPGGAGPRGQPWSRPVSAPRTTSRASGRSRRSARPRSPAGDQY